MTKHIPVLLSEVLDYIVVDTEGTYLDATFGTGGHSRGLLEHLGEGAKLVVSDRDSRALVEAQPLAAKDKRVTIVSAKFSELGSALSSHHGAISGVLFDLGVSSPQLDLPERGFSFQTEGPLDMRMNPTSGITASEWRNSATEAEIADTLYKYGEERFSRRIARDISLARAVSYTHLTLPTKA